MTRKDPLETAKAILEAKSSKKTEGVHSEMKMDEKEMYAEMEAMKEAMMKEMSDSDATKEEIEEMMAKMEAMSYKEMKEMMKKEGIKYETAMAEEAEEPEVAKKKTDEPDATRADTESDLETLKATKKTKKVDAGKIKPSAAKAFSAEKKDLTVKEDLDALFTGEELTEDFKEKAEIIFESAINVRVENELEELKEEFAVQLEESKTEFRTELANKLDEYLSYVVEEWMQENKLAIDSGIRADIAESFMGGLKTLFETHYITVPDDKYDLLEDLNNEIKSLKGSLNEQIEKNISLKQDAMISRCINVFNEVSNGLTDSETEKLKSLAEGLEYDSEDQFRDKLTVLRESYFDHVSESNELATEIVGDTITESVEEGASKPDLNGSMKFYSDMLTRSAIVQKQTNFTG